MSSYSVAWIECPFCKGIVKPGDTKCRWCLSPLAQQIKHIQGPTRAPLSWSRSDRSYVDHFAWKTLVSPGDPVLVQEGETAVKIQGGKVQAALPYGMSSVSASQDSSSSRLVGVLFSKTGVQTFKWGQGELATSDGIPVGASGTISIHQVDPVKLLRLFPSGQAYLSVKDLKVPIFRAIRGVLEGLINQWISMNIMGAGMKIAGMAASQLGPGLADMGLEVSDFEIQRLSLPDEFREAIQRQGIRNLETKTEVAKFEQFKKVGIDVNKLATMEKIAEKAGGLNLVTGNYVAGSNIEDSVLVRSHVGATGKVEDPDVLQLTAQCPSCKSPLDPTTHKFCAQCGIRFRFCPDCRIVIQDPGRFCSECGRALN